MVTRGALHPARHALDCFQRQTYPERELIIVCDRPGAPLARHVAALGDPRIRFVETTPAPLGSLRNVSVEAALGTLVCQWDDDDLYSRDRLTLQRAALDRGAVDACFLSRWTLWWPARRRLAISGKRVWEGSMLARREAIGRYPALATGEDTAMLATHRAVALDAPSAYCYVVHGKNSRGDAHFERLFDAAQRPDATYEDALEILGRVVPLSAYETSLC